MKFNFVRKNQIVLDKVTLKKFRVDDVCDGEAVLGEVLESPNQEMHVTTMRPENAICFRLLEDPNPLDIPAGDWECQDGVLLMEGDPAIEEQGELKVNRVLGKIRGGVVVEYQTGDKPELGIYNPVLDKFIRIREAAEEDKFLTDVNGKGFISCLRLDRKVEKQEDGTEEENTYVKDSTVTVFNRHGILQDIKVPSFCPIIIPESAILKSSSIQKIGDEAVAVHGSFFLAETGAIATPGDEVVASKNGFLLLLESGDVEAYSGLQITASFTKSLRHGFVAKDNSTLVYHTKDGEQERLEAPKLQECIGYDYLVDISSKGNTNRFVFANEQHVIKVLTQTRTNDRGCIYAVSDTL